MKKSAMKVKTWCEYSVNQKKCNKKLWQFSFGKLFLLVGALAVLPFEILAATSKGQGNIKVEAKVPKEAEISKSVKLECSWRLYGNNTLYSVKWYKNEHEFFSYNPDNEPQNQIKTHPLDGVSIDLRMSNKNLVRLTNLTLNSTGQYKCEVSGGAPFFATNYVKGNLTIIVPPNQGPEIRGLANQYALGDNVTANCTAWPSVPKARLHWTINNHTVPTEYVIEHPPLQPMKSQGTPNSLGLRFELDQRHFTDWGSTLRLRCIAHVGSRRYETEHHAQMPHANNQRFSAGEIRSHANSAIYDITLLFVAFLLTT